MARKYRRVEKSERSIEEGACAMCESDSCALSACVASSDYEGSRRAPSHEQGLYCGVLRVLCRVLCVFT